jgi:hypothetical protein
MLKYTLPPMKKEKGKGNLEVYDDVTESSWYREVTLPATKEMINSLTVGESQDIHLTCEVIGLEIKEREGKKQSGEIRIRLKSVAIDSLDSDNQAIVDLNKDDM